MIINQIDIKSAITTAFQDGGCSVEIEWVLNNGETADPYTGAYTAVLYDGETEQTVDFEDTEGKRAKTLEFSNLACGKSYKLALKVPPEQGGAASKKVNVFIDTFQNIAGTFDGEFLALTWELTSNLWLEGLCQIDYGGRFSDYYNIAASKRSLQLRLLKALPGETLAVSLRVSDDAGSKGINSTVRFQSSGLRITAGELKKADDGKSAQLQLTADSDYSDLKKAFVYLYKDKDILWRSEPMDLKAAGNTGNAYICTAEIPASVLEYSAVKNCAARITAVSGGAESTAPDPADTLPLQTPDLLVKSVKKEGYVCAVHMPETAWPPYGYVLSDGQLVGNDDFTVGFEKSPDITSVRAAYSKGGVQQCGPQAEAAVFLPGYYPNLSGSEEDELVYHEKSLTDSRIDIPVGADIVGALEGDIPGDVISLTKGDQGYVLSVNTAAILEADAMEGFLSQAEGKLPVYGIYVLRDLIMRTAHFKEPDTAALLCGMDAEQRWADICPGMGLQVSTASYMNQESLTGGTIAGFVAGYSECYPVTIQKGAEYLEFDCFAGAMAKNMSSQSLTNGDGHIVYVADITDFLQPSIRQPYYRILYPESFRPAVSIESPYPSENFLILASDSYNSLLQACETLKNNPAAINSLDIPIVIFRGRSRLSLRFQILVGNEQIYVPVGTTLGDVLQQWGIHSTTELRLSRRNHAGKKTEVYLPVFDNPEDIVLITGDSIDFR